jgi:cytochrome c oxidase cbb3-type subunit 1
MKKKLVHFLSGSLILLIMSYSLPARAEAASTNGTISTIGAGLLVGFSVFVLLLLLLWLFKVVKNLREEAAGIEPADDDIYLFDQVSRLNTDQINKLIRHKGIKRNKSDRGKGSDKGFKALTIGLLLTCSASVLHAQPTATAVDTSVWGSPGMMIMLTLILIPLLVTVLLIGIKLHRLTKKAHYTRVKSEANHLSGLVAENEDFYNDLLNRKEALNFKLSDTELAGAARPEDSKGLLHNIAEVNTVRFIAPKRKASQKHNVDPALVKLILWYLGTATLWLVVGTSIGEYLGIKFVAPDADHVSWLSFGRLRPVHTNMVFWGWSSLAMLGLGNYVVGVVSNTTLASIKKGYWALALINVAVILGSLALMAGINNGGGEYREYIWPVMGLFAAGLVISLINYIQTIAQRKTKEIYISNWYIIAAMMFLTVIVIVGYAPWWQNGLGETIVQGYYMHQAVGMWFMLFNLGLIYYFLPQQLNTPIYSYSLGILAFWAQILFYTLIGTHHFLFSSIPWWLQTVAIVGSMGMLIPVFSGTTNFLMTLRGNYHKIARSYTLPFYLTGIIFYFTGSTQGTAEAFRSTNLIWHFTDFTVAHSHLTMYGIIAFMLWASIYTLVPRLTGTEPKQGWVGAHFWMALIGMLFYTIPLMTGGTLKGMGWVAGKPFIDGVVLMAPYWLWRAIGGSLMWGSHLIFAWNMYVMATAKSEADIQTQVFEELSPAPNLQVNTSSL